MSGAQIQIALADSARRLHNFQQMGASRAAMSERAIARHLLNRLADMHGHLALQMGRQHYQWTLDIEMAREFGREVEAWHGESQAA